MGCIQSVCCSIIFCVERVLTWTCCAFLLMLLMFSIISLMVYGISVGYHYAQKELVSFAMSSSQTSQRSGPDTRPVERLVNRSEVDQEPHPILEVYETKNPGTNVYLETTEMPAVVLETEGPPQNLDMLPRAGELTRLLIGRFRRSKNVTSTDNPFLRPLKNVSEFPRILTAT